MFTVPANSTRQHLTLDIQTQGRQRFRIHGVVGSGNILLNDGTFVQISGHIVGGCTNQLDATVMRLVIGLGALEAG